MKKLTLTLLSILFLPSIAFAALVPVPVTRDTTTGFIRPTQATDNLRIPALSGSGTICLEVDNNGQLQLASSMTACGSGGGGGGGAGTFSTTTTGGLLQYPYTTLTTSLDTNSTSTSKWWFNPTLNRTVMTGSLGIGTTSPYAKLSVVGQIVAQYFTATGTTASTFPYASTTALSATTLYGALVGNASTATTLQTARNINGTSFNGSADITITAASSTLLANNNTFSGTNIINISRASNLTSNGFVKTSGGNGALSVDTTTYESGLTAGDGLTRTANDFDCDTASGSVFGCLSSTDWTTFNNKQAAGNYITALTGDVTASGPGSVAATLATVNSNVGSFTNANITVNAKGLITAASNGTGGTSAYNIATSSTIGVSQLSYFTKTSGLTTLGGVATTSVTCTGSATCDPFTVIGSSPITINASAGSGVGLATSTPIVDTYVIYGTSAGTVGAESAFTYDDATDRLTVINASTTNISVSGEISLSSTANLRDMMGSVGTIGQCLTSAVGVGGGVIWYECPKLSTTNSWSGINTFTVKTNLANASSTQFSAGRAWFGETATSSFSTAGVLTLASALTVANGGTGAATFGQGWIHSSGGTTALTSSTSPTVNYVTATSTTVASTFPYASTTALTVSGTLYANIKYYPAFTFSTTTWSGTTTIPLGPAYAAETWNGIKCFTDTGTVNVSLYDGTNRMNMFNASTTVGQVTLSTNNTFTASEKRYVDLGTPASSPKSVSCSASITREAN